MLSMMQKQCIYWKRLTDNDRMNMCMYVCMTWTGDTFLRSRVFIPSVAQQ